MKYSMSWTQIFFFLECQIQNLLSTLFSILARQFPSQVLSAILKRPIAAFTNGDTLKEIVSSLKNVSMLTNLRHGEYFGTRPIVSYIDNQNKTSFGQIYPDGNVYSDIVFIEKYRSGRSLTFCLNKRFYTYYNYRSFTKSTMYTFFRRHLRLSTSTLTR